MAKKLYVGGLAWATTQQGLQAAFQEIGPVVSAVVMTDNMTGRSRGFGFVEMEDADALKAIDALNGKDLDGRKITVNEARPMAPRGERPQRNDGGGFGGGRY